MVLLATTIPVLATSTASDQAGARYDIYNLGNGNYRVIISAKSPNNISYFSTIFSFDNTVVQPVHRDTKTDISTSSDTNYAFAFKPLAWAVNNVAFTPVYEGWKTNGTRTAFNYGVVATDGTATGTLSHVVSNGQYKPMFAFYFKVKAGKTVTTSTFKFEKGGSGSFVAMYNPANDTAGIRMNAAGGGEGASIFVQGSNNTVTHPDTAGAPADTSFKGSMPKLGDVNGDNDINAADLSILRANFGKSDANPAADLNGDGDVNAADLSILRANFGK